MAQNIESTLPELLPETQAVFDILSADAKIQAGLKTAFDQDDACLQEQITITEIPSWPFGEHLRAADFVERFNALGLKDVHIDEVGNVIGTRPGVGPEPRTKLVIAAHLDTVFTETTDYKVKKEGNRYLAPSIGDDTRGLASLLQVIRCLQENNIETVGDIVFVGDVGEEGVGDLRGVKHIFKNADVDIDGFISIDWCDPTVAIVGATGSLRYRVNFDGPGGHSYLGFGIPSAIHALMRTSETLADLEVPADPKTTYTVGVITGGSTVNSIAAHAHMDIDMRSTENTSLLALRDKIFPAFQKACDDENAHWGVTDPAMQIKCTIEQIGDRPAGQQPYESPVCQAIRGGLKQLGLPLTKYISTSGDHNVALSLGIPALAMGGGGDNGKMHTVDEWYEHNDGYKGPQLTFLMACALSGVNGLTKGIMPKRQH